MAADLFKELVPFLIKMGMEKDIPTLLAKKHGFIVKRAPGVYKGTKGDFVWDYIIWNQITFDTEDGKIVPFFDSISDEDTEKEWHKLTSQYGV